MPLLVDYYLCLLQDAPMESKIVLGPSTVSSFTLNSTHIEENAKYSYRVRATNKFNISSDIESEFCEFNILYFFLWLLFV